MSAAALGLASAAGAVSLSWRPFSFPLPTALQTAAGAVAHRHGWLLRLQTTAGASGWGEVCPLAFGSAGQRALDACAEALRQLPPALARDALEEQLPSLPPPVGFALGAALAEADGLVGPAAGGWRQPPHSAWLLPAGEDALKVAQTLLAQRVRAPVQGAPARDGGPCALNGPLTLKWKVGVYSVQQEQNWYGELAGGLPADARLRLDANGGFDRATAWRWADLLGGDGRLDWLEQPLDPADHGGLEALACQVPVALDESLRRFPALRHRWPGWQVRRPALEGDPRPLLLELQGGRPWLMVSTSFETGIGRRWLAHLAALQAEGPTPTAPGLAPGWEAPGDLGSERPETVWRAALAG